MKTLIIFSLITLCYLPSAAQIFPHPSGVTIVFVYRIVIEE